MNDNPSPYEELSDRVSTIGHFLSASNDGEQIRRDVADLVTLLASSHMSLSRVLGDGVHCQVKGGHLKQGAIVHTGNWREILVKLRGLSLAADEAMRLDLCAHLDELSGRDLQQLQLIADIYL